ncbi:MAG: SpoIIE family protein phosphatase [Vicingaceae bacterium]|nr:SpoIIE family protein phosphatase [Vicingaceae bacterium]
MIQNKSNIDWKTELDKTILRYHTIALWVAVVFNMLFFVTDYFNLHAYWQEFLTFRTGVSFVCLITVLFHKKLKIPIEILGFIPVFLISIQNAYMWSVMDLEHLQKHAFAYIALFIGSGMFMFYRMFFSILIVVANIIANVVFFYFNSELLIDEILVSGGLLTGAVAVFSILLIRMRYRLTKKELIARFALEKSKKEVEEKNKEIIDSINYAKRIQDALITPPSVLKKILPDSFCIFLPKDIVSGDFYWASEVTTTNQDKSNEKVVVFSVADCTGHGVSGAFVSIIGLKILNQSIKDKGVNSPVDALNFLNQEVYNTINLHTEEESELRDGMDIAFCSINSATLKMEYAGANNPVYVIRKALPYLPFGEENPHTSHPQNKGFVRESSSPSERLGGVELIEIKADKQPIGAYVGNQPFSNKTYQLEKGDMVYVFSDGYADQFGGEKEKKFNYRQFKLLLGEVSSLPTEQQKEKILKTFYDWKGDLEQLDDVCIIGVRI